MLSKEWVYENIFKMSNEETDRQKSSMINDLKDRFRFRSIEDEGSDPVEEDDEDIEESLEKIKKEIKNKGGRPREGNTYKKDKHPYGRETLLEMMNVQIHRKRETREGQSFIKPIQRNC